MIEEIIKKQSRECDKRGYGNGRLIMDLEEIIPLLEGNILEIGVGGGQMTKIFGKVALKHDRKILIVDPFEKGWDDMPVSYRYTYESFLQTTVGWKDIIIHCKEASQHKSVPGFLEKHAPIAFAFVDGLQEEGSVLSDLRLVEKLKVPFICVDDMNRVYVTKDVETFLKESKYRIIKLNENNREGYLIRN